MKNGKQVECYGTLSEIEELIPQEHWIRVNRQTLVMRDSIMHYNSFELCINVNGQEQNIQYYSTKPYEVLETLKNWNPSLYSSADSLGRKSNVILFGELKQLQDFLEKNPEASANQVSEAFHWSLRTSYRRMAELRRRN